MEVFGKRQKEIKKIANTFLEVAPTFISNNILNVDVRVLATAERTSKTGPNTTTNAVVAFIVGSVTCLFIFVIIELLKNTIENEKDFKSRYDIPLLGIVPIFENKQNGGKRRGISKQS